MKIKKQSSAKKWVIIAAIAILVSIGTSALLYLQNNNQASPASPDTPAQAEPLPSDELTTNPQPVQPTNPAISAEFAKLLPYETEHFSIQKTQDSFEISLFAILNQPSQYDDYITQLKQYKLEALDFIKSKGFDPAMLPLMYSPEEAKDY